MATAAYAGASKGANGESQVGHGDAPASDSQRLELKVADFDEAAPEGVVSAERRLVAA